MAELKTKVTTLSPTVFINTVENEQKKKDAKLLLKLFTDITGQKPKMWGASIVGYGMYHYKSDKSTQEGDWPLTGFSPRKQNFTLYIMQGFDGMSPLLEKLGKHKISGGSCLYINKLTDINIDVLEKIIEKGYLGMKKKHSVK